MIRKEKDKSQESKSKKEENSIRKMQGNMGNQRNYFKMIHMSKKEKEN